MEQPSVDRPYLPSQKVIIGGVQAFILFSAAGTLLSIWWKRPSNFDEFIAGIEWRWAILLAPMIWLDYWLGGWRYRLFFNGKQLPDISQWDCMRSNWANMFMGAATPFQTGGGPAQLFILWRKGASVTESLLVSLVNYVATLVFFLTASIAAIVLLPEDLFGVNFTVVFRSGFALIASVASVVLVIFLFPKTGDKIIRFLIKLLPIGPAKKQSLLTKAEDEIRRFHEGFRSILKENKRGLVLTLFATLLLYFNKYLIGYAICLALGQSVPIGIFIGLQIIQMMLLYFAPTPGASGLAELSSVWLMGKLVPESLLVVYSVLQRLVTTVLAAVIGGIVLIQELRNRQVR